jgi:hypothetical protein
MRVKQKVFRIERALDLAQMSRLKQDESKQSPFRIGTGGRDGSLGHERSLEL